MYEVLEQKTVENQPKWDLIGFKIKWKTNFPFKAALKQTYKKLMNESADKKCNNIYGGHT